MAGVFNTGVNRQTGTRTVSSDPLIPDELSSTILQELPQQSAVLNMARRMAMSSTTQRMPVLDVLPTAYWVGGDSGLKQTTSMAWKDVNLVVEELAAIVPIPDAYLADATVPLWDEIRPRMVEALGKKIDSACLFGVNMPSTWSTPIVPQAIASGNVVTSGTGTDLPQDIAMLAEDLTQDGYTNVDGWAVRPGFKWRLLQTRSAQGQPIYQPDLQNGRGGSLYGYPMAEVSNGAWDPTVADLLLGDWSKAIVGMRQDITFKMFDQGVISDESGNVVWNAMQQDGQAMRVVMRLAFATANPVTSLNTNDATRYPFGVLKAATSGGLSGASTPQVQATESSKRASK